MKRAVLVCELYPRDRASGQEKYNNDVAQALRASGYRIDLIVTSPRRDLLPARVPDRNDLWQSTTLIHFRATAAGLIPRSMASSLRLAKGLMRRIVPAIVLGRGAANGGAKTGVARIGRWLGARERTQVRQAIARRSPDLVLFDTIFRDPGPVAEPDYPRVLIMHDIFHLRSRSFRDNGFMPVPDISPDEEIARWSRFDGLIAINAEEAARARTLLGERPVRTLYPMVEPASAPPVSLRARPPGIMFLGANGAHNQDALAWFVRECWPAILDAVPTCTLHVVGSVTAPEHASGRIVLHGHLDDLAAVARTCTLAINPVRMGSGLKIKMLDYLRHGLPVVTSSIGAEGYPGDPPRPFIVVDPADDFIRSIVTLLSNAEEARALASLIDDYLTIFSPDTARDVLGRLIADVTNSRCPT
ncbi:glycosyltransferase [Sphingomonas sp. Mn802worker]|uniref:glycosyltransferase n=1 Tax=Sphingomonas sp. Mn802worker TaxID=629773 RepID=UPI000373D752|nr:glycosyltransferase [Sphingomonas sp. Mn802worker]